MKDTGFELEAFTRPMRDLAINAGVTYSDTVIATIWSVPTGKPLTNALLQLPGPADLERSEMDRDGLGSAGRRRSATAACVA